MQTTECQTHIFRLESKSARESLNLGYTTSERLELSADITYTYATANIKDKTKTRSQHKKP